MTGSVVFAPPGGVGGRCEDGGGVAGTGEGFVAAGVALVEIELMVGACTFACTLTGAGLAEFCFGVC